jgi:hypothetical protein
MADDKLSPDHVREIADQIAMRILERLDVRLPGVGRYDCTGDGYTCANEQGYVCGGFGQSHSCTGVFTCGGKGFSDKGRPL